MVLGKLLIANTQVGLENDQTPWLIPDDAYPTMDDFYIFRGRVLSRKGCKGIGRMVAATVSSQASISSSTTANYNNTVASTIEPGTMELYFYDSSGPPPTLVILFQDTGSGGLVQSGATSYNIEDITQASPAVVTSTGHGLLNGQTLVIQDVQGLTSPVDGSSAVNGKAFVVANAAANTFELSGLDTSTFYEYSTGGTVAIGGSINYATGAYVISWLTLAGTTPYNLVIRYNVSNVFPCLPVMGIKTREISSINSEETIFFDTSKANEYSGTAFNDISFYKNTNGAVSWSGSNSQFFNSTNYANTFWATNFVPGLHTSATATTTGDGIRWYDGNQAFTNGWVNFNPRVDQVASPNTNRVLGARLIVPYIGRLLIFNTYEGTSSPGTHYPRRVRWSQIGTPFPATDPGGAASPIPSDFAGLSSDDAWVSTVPGLGGFLDCPNNEEIISIGWYKDQLIVFFEKSTWALLYTGNRLFPFTFERINSELGCESPNSTVQFDDGILAVGNRGVVQATGNQVVRIDSRIPDEVFNFKNEQEGHLRVQGIRDYFNELAYWTVPEAESEYTFPGRLLVFNYKTGSFSFFRDSFTALGYIQFSQGYLWNTTDTQWGEADWNWDDPISQSLFQNICAGNSMGYVFILNVQNDNDPSMDILTYDFSGGLDNLLVTTCGENNLNTNDHVKFSGVTGMELAGVSTTFASASIASTTYSSQFTDLAILPGSVTITIGANVFTDTLGDNVLTPGGGSIDYESGKFTVYFSSLAAITPVTAVHTQTINGKVVKVIRQSNTQVKLDFNFIGFSNPTDATGEMAFVNRPKLQTKRINPFIAEDHLVKFITTDCI